MAIEGSRDINQDIDHRSITMNVFIILKGKQQNKKSKTRSAWRRDYYSIQSHIICTSVFVNYYYDKFFYGSSDSNTFTDSKHVPISDGKSCPALYYILQSVV